MGPAGAGKTTVGERLAASLGWPFADADAFHPAANVEKMRRGEGLTDADRAPWLAALRDHIAATLAAGGHLVLACSALRRAYRDALLPADAPAEAVRFAYLHVSRETLARRLARRRGPGEQRRDPRRLGASELPVLAVDVVDDLGHGGEPRRGQPEAREQRLERAAVALVRVLAVVHVEAQLAGARRVGGCPRRDEA